MKIAKILLVIINTDLGEGISPLFTIIPGPNILLIRCCYKTIVGRVLPSLQNQVISALTEFAHLDTKCVVDNGTGSGDVYVIKAFVLHLRVIGFDAVDGAGPVLDLTLKVFMAAQREMS